MGIERAPRAVALDNYGVIAAVLFPDRSLFVEILGQRLHNITVYVG